MQTSSRFFSTLAGLLLTLSLSAQIREAPPTEVTPPEPVLPQVAPPRPLPNPQASSGEPELANGIAAVVEDRIITIDEVRREISLLVPQLQRDARNEAEFQQALGKLQDEVIQSLVDRVLVVKHFEKEGFVVPSSYIESELKDLIRRDFDDNRGRFLQFLQSQGISVRDFRKDLEERIVVDYMRGQMRRSESIVSPERMEQFYEEKKSTFYQDEAVHLRIIQLSSLTNESKDILLQTAENIARELENGTSFAELAQRYSQDKRRREGGSWGWIKTDELREDWRDVIAALEVGEASGPIEAAEGIYILYVEDYREAGIQPIHEVRDQIETILASQMAREDQERWLERLRRNAYVRYYL